MFSNVERNVMYLFCTVQLLSVKLVIYVRVTYDPDIRRLVSYRISSKNNESRSDCVSVYLSLASDALSVTGISDLLSYRLLIGARVIFIVGKCNNCVSRKISFSFCTSTCSALDPTFYLKRRRYVCCIKKDEIQRTFR